MERQAGVCQSPDTSQAQVVKSNGILHAHIPFLAGRVPVKLRRERASEIHIAVVFWVVILWRGLRKRLRSEPPPWIATNWGSDIYLYGKLREHLHIPLLNTEFAKLPPTYMEEYFHRSALYGIFPSFFNGDVMENGKWKIVHFFKDPALYRSVHGCAEGPQSAPVQLSLDQPVMFPPSS